MRSFVSHIAIGVCLIVSNQALAQQVKAPDAAADSSSGTPAKSDDIVVTGTHQASRLQNTPVSISAVSSATIAMTGFKNPQELQYLVPGLSFNATVGAGFLIRGIGTQGFDYSLDKSVGVIVDDVVQSLPRSIGFNSFNDLDQVEVLKGPQGTLFGKNASAGVIYVTTKKPVLGQYSVDGSLTYGSRNDVQIQNVVNVPVTDTLAVRVSGLYQRQDGFLNNTYSQTKGGASRDYSVRGKVLWQPADNLEVYAIGDVQDHWDGGFGVLGTVRQLGTGSSAVDFASLLAQYGITPGVNNKSYAHDAPDYVATHQADAQLNIKYKLGGYTLTSISAYQRLSSGSQVDIDQNPINFYNLVNSVLTAHQITQEFRLASPRYGFLDYNLGAFYYRSIVDAADRSGGTLGEDLGQNTLYSFSGSRQDFHVSTESYAFFANANAHINDKLTLLGGLRYTHDNVRQNYTPASDPEYTFLGTIEPAAGGRTSGGNVSGKVSLQYNPTSDIMTYATYSTGYKAPGVTISGGSVEIIKPETVRNFEVGARTQFMDRRITLNATLFAEKFHNFQAPVAEIVDNTYQTVMSNSPGLLSHGVEADASAKVTDSLTLSGSVSYAKTKYEGFIISCYPNEATIASQGYGCYALGSGTAQDVSGLPSIQAPEVSFTLNANYRHPISPRLEGFANANYYHRSSAYASAGDPNSVIPAYGVLNLTMGIGNPRTGAKVSVFANNVLNKYVITNILPITFAPTASYLQYPSAESARTVGVRFDYSFH